MDTITHNALHKYPWEHPEDPDLEREEPVKDPDNLGEEQLDPKEHPDDPGCNRPQPWGNADDADYADETGKPTRTKRRCKAFYY